MRIPPFVVVLALLSPFAIGTAQDSKAVFEEEVDIEIVNLTVSVLDAHGNPVTGLATRDFVVTQDGSPVEVTNLSGPAGRDSNVTDAPTARAGVAEETAEPGVVAGNPTSFDAPFAPEHLLLLFDNVSLERRTRKRVLDSLLPFSEQEAGRGTRIMVATTNPALQVVQPFTSEVLEVADALKTVRSSESSGDMIKKSKRMMIREMQSATTVRAKFGPPTGVGGSSVGSGGSGGSSGSGSTNGGSGGDGTSGSGGTRRGFAGSTAAGLDATTDSSGWESERYKLQVDTQREKEYGRVFNAIIGLDTAVRALAGVPGKKNLVWVGEDLALRPGIDLYRVFFSKFEKWSQSRGYELPEMWASERELLDEFQYVVGSAQTAGVTLHLIDASDRDRELASADFGAADTESHKASNPRGVGVTGGYGMSSTNDMDEGSRYLALATGGMFFGRSRDFDRFADELGEVIRGSYSLGYLSPEPADGRLHSVDVRVPSCTGCRVRHHEKIAAVSAAHRLADRAFSRLVLGTGSNLLEVSAQLLATQDQGDGTVERTVRMVVPTINLDLELRGEAHVGMLTVAAVVASPSGETTPPGLFQLEVSVPDEDVPAPSTVATDFRLLTKEDSQTLSLAVRDEGSGLEGTVLLLLDR